MKNAKKTIAVAIISCLILTCAFLLTACKDNGDDKTPSDKAALSLKSNTNSEEIDIYETTYAVVNLPSLFNEELSGLSYEITSSSDTLTLSSISSAGSFNIISNGTLGNFIINVIVVYEKKQILSFDIDVSVIDGSPDPVLTLPIPNASAVAPLFASGDIQTYFEYNIDLSEYFDAASNIVYEMVCSDTSANMTADDVKPYLVTLNFITLGEKQITIYSVKRGVRKAHTSFVLTLTGDTPYQLINGGFENGYTGWNLDSWSKASYNIIDDSVDLWGNSVDADGRYLYGYHNEAGTCEFTSSIFTISGSGYLTWKMAGNCTEDLQFILMKYNPDGEDVEIDKFNNWYYGVYAGSGFIFRQYYYQLDSIYADSKCYFKIIDNRTADFGFVNLDSIVTYYETAPSVEEMYEAGYLESPDGIELNYSDTSNIPFPSDLSKVGNQLVNGDFEQGFNGWYMTHAEKNAYGIYGSKTDIFNNPVNATGNYLYGYEDESFASANFHSALFKAEGSGMITWKMAGNCTEDLQFILMKYNPEGEDIEIAKFNNWYFKDSNESGFIFRNYFYQIDMTAYGGSYMYFVVKDYKSSYFGFICLDDIVTYYAAAPAVADFYKGGYCKNPDNEV